jgi:two-component system, cell cycle sensor histidine kinase and response regulator CckA
MGKPLRILNVEDSPQDVMLLTRHLTSSGYEITNDRVETAAEMEAALAACEWDVILCDYSMPKFNAIAALELLHETRLDIPFIIISGTVGEEIAVEAMLSGANDYLPKNNLMRLVPAIERELTEAENRRLQRRAEEERRIISEIVQGVLTAPALDEFLSLVHRSISQLVFADNCFVMLHDLEHDINHYEFWVDKSDARPVPRPMGKGFASYVLREGKPLLLNEGTRRRMIERGEVEQIGSSSSSWLGVPLRTPQRNIGVLVLQDYDDADTYSQRDLEFVSSVGDQIAMAIERKRSEQEIRLQATALEATANAMVITDTAGNITWVNPAFTALTGYTSDEAVGENPRLLNSGKHSNDLYRDLWSTLLAGNVWQGEMVNRRKDGSLYIEEQVITPVTSESGEVINFIAVKQDITERRHAEKALIESEERYRELVENAIDIIYTHDLQGNFTSVNKAAERITGYAREEAMSMNIAHTIVPEYLEKAREMVQSKLAGRDVTAYELEILAKDGRRVAVEVNTRVIFQNGQPYAIQGIARDITERKHLEEQFLQAQKMEAIGLLAGGIAHDFNNLLTAISGYSDLTLKKMEPDHPLRPNVEEIKDAGARAANLTGQLLAFSRKQVLKPRVHNVNAVITEIERMLKRIIRESVELRTVLDPDLGNIKADPGQIEQVIVNLAVNARDAMSGGGTLILETKNIYLNEEDARLHPKLSTGPFVKIIVTDTGEGMDEHVQRRIFEPFFTTKEIGKGSGLGLSTVHGIVKQSGGDIMVESAQGQGTRFEIFLPCVDENVQKPRWEETSYEEFTGTETILLVEDEEAVRKLVREILGTSGYKVLEAAGGSSALAICDAYTEPIHMLLTDVIMPKMGGVELKQRVVERRPQIKTLYMSGYTDDSVISSGLLDTGTAFIEKPFTPDDLARKVREVLDK